MCREKLNQLGTECSLELLKRYIGMRCEITINTHTHDNKVMATYTYEKFDCDIGNFILCLFDSKDGTLNTRINNDLILEIRNNCEDVYDDVVHIYTEDFILSVTTLESLPILLHCNHCNKEIDVIDNEYWLSGAYDSLRICEDCALTLFPINEEVGGYND